MTYVNAATAPTTARTMSFTANDGAAGNNLSNVATRTITITPVNDAPACDDLEGGSASFTEGDGSPDGHLGDHCGRPR